MSLLSKKEFKINGNHINYILEILDHEHKDVSCKFILREVTSWEMDGTPILQKDDEYFLEGYVNWDGCSHVNFGDMGYIHLRGKEYWMELSEILPLVYNECIKHISKYDKSVAE